MIYVVRYALVALYTAFWGAVACLAAPFDRDGRTVVWVARRWVAWILRTCGIRADVDGLENVPFDRPCVYMSNHQSVFDIVAVVATLPVSWVFVAKRELTWIPLFGWALALGHQIIVDRRNREASVRSLSRAAERVRAGANVIIFPEGTRSPDASLQEFKSGASTSRSRRASRSSRSPSPAPGGSRRSGRCGSRAAGCWSATGRRSRRKASASPTGAI